eukprot:COSAG01_NODE_4357_length_5106_cov_67.646295_1_plen_42_part_00
MSSHGLAHGRTGGRAGVGEERGGGDGVELGPMVCLDVHEHA